MSQPDAVATLIKEAAKGAAAAANWAAAKNLQVSVR